MFAARYFCWTWAFWPDGCRATLVFHEQHRTDHVGSIAALPVGLSNSSAFTILIYALACVRYLVHYRAA